MNFGEKVAKIRKSRKLTQQEAADIMKMSLVSYRKLEYTHVKPRFTTIEIVMANFNVNIEDLFPEFSKSIAELGKSEQELLSNFNRLTDEQKVKVIELIKLM